MSKAIRSIVTLLILLHFNNVSAQWITESTISGKYLYDYKKSIKNIFLITAEDLYKKSGGTLNKVSLPFSGGLGQVFITDSLLIVSNYSNSGGQPTMFDYYVSLDEGISYSKLDLPRNQLINGIVNYNGKYTMSMGGSIYNSGDALTWENVYTDEDEYGEIKEICGFNNYIIGIHNTNGLISSKDQGRTWELVQETPLDPLAIQNIGSSSQYLYVTWVYEKRISWTISENASGVYRYDGLEWKLIMYDNQMMYFWHLYVDNMFVGLLTNGAVYLSNDGGDSFKNFQNRSVKKWIEPQGIVTFQDSIFLILRGGAAWKRVLDEMDFTLLPIPFNLQVVHDGSIAELTWKADLIPHDGFIIERSPYWFEIYDRVDSGIKRYIDINPGGIKTYRVFSYDSVGWSLPQKIFKIDDYITFIEDTSFRNLELFPNPVRDVLYVKPINRAPLQLIVYDLLGNKLNPNMVKLPNDIIRIDLKGLPKTLLIIRVTLFDESMEYHRLIHY